MDEVWVVERAKLRDLIRAHPTWSVRQLMAASGHSRSFVKKWCKRLKAATDGDEHVLHGLSRRRRQPPATVDERLVEAILDIRDHPPEALGRVAGPRAIRYYLSQLPELQAAGLKWPSTSTIWKVLDTHQRILRPREVTHEPLERPAPMSEWEIDFADVTSVVPQPEGKQPHVVELLNVVDRGTSILVESRPDDDYNAESTVVALTDIFIANGLPTQIRMDRDPRLVASWTMDGFPSALVRYLLCLGVQVAVCPPHRPDLKPFVERFNRTVAHECLERVLPESLEAAQPVVSAYKVFYNTERPHQGSACQNQPPYTAFPALPARRPLPARVDADGWVNAFDKQPFRRRITAQGTVSVDTDRYYIGRQFQGRYVVLWVDAPQHQLRVELAGQVIKTLPLKCLLGGSMLFADYFELICRQARSEARRLQLAAAARRRRVA